MTNLLRIVGISVLAAGWIAAIALAFYRQDLLKENEALQEEVQLMQLTLQRLLDTRHDKSEDSDGITLDEWRDRQRGASDDRGARIEELERQLADARVQIDALTQQEAEEVDSERPVTPFAAIYENFTDDMARTMASGQASMMYKDFLNALSLTPERRREIMDIIADFKGAEMYSQIQAARNELTPADVQALDYPGQLRKALSTVLNAEELKYYDEYEAGMDERMIRQSYGMQLDMFAGDLSPESRTIALDVLVDEMMIQQAERTAAPEQVANPSAEFEEAIYTFEHASMRLAELLPGDQFAAFDRFVQQQVNSIRMAQQMMGRQEQTTTP